jgi:hypothetical protein
MWRTIQYCVTRQSLVHFCSFTQKHISQSKQCKKFFHHFINCVQSQKNSKLRWAPLSLSLLSSAQQPFKLLDLYCLKKSCYTTEMKDSNVESTLPPTADSASISAPVPNAGASPTQPSDITATALPQLSPGVVAAVAEALHRWQPWTSEYYQHCTWIHVSHILSTSLYLFMKTTLTSSHFVFFRLLYLSRFLLHSLSVSLSLIGVLLLR